MAHDEGGGAAAASALLLLGQAELARGKGDKAVEALAQVNVF